MTSGTKNNTFVFAPLDTCSICGTAPVSTHCSTCIQKLCLNCDRLFHSHPDRGDHDRTMVSTVKPQGAAARLETGTWWCTVHKHHRRHRPFISLLFLLSSSLSFSSWECGHCTTVNPMRAVLCGTCERPRLANAASSGEEDLLQSPSNTGLTTGFPRRLKKFKIRNFKWKALKRLKNGRGKTLRKYSIRDSGCECAGETTSYTHSLFSLSI